ncbi:hypothetical protein ACFLZ1_02615 [Patescibacteria group bacterium]
MKKILPLVIVIVLLAASFFGWKLLKGKKDVVEEKRPKKAKVENVNKLPLEQRPYVLIEPKSKIRPNDLGYWITISIYNADDYQGVDYEVEYQAGTLIQGFRHSLDFSKEEKPYAKESFFGSESKGKYYYHENMIGGSILLQFFKDVTTYDALKTQFNIQNMEEKEGMFTSNDAKASLEVDEKDMSKSYWVLIASTLGLPEPLEGKVLSEPYGFYAHKALSFENTTLTIKSKEDLTNAKIMGWNGEEWVEYETEVNEDSASTKIDSLGTYVLVSFQEAETE